MTHIVDGDDRLTVLRARLVSRPPAVRDVAVIRHQFRYYVSRRKSLESATITCDARRSYHGIFGNHLFTA